MFVFALAVVFKLCTIQFVDGDKYRAMAQKRTIKRFDIPANRGNVYSADGSLLATSIPKYDISKCAVVRVAVIVADALTSDIMMSKYSSKSLQFFSAEVVASAKLLSFSKQHLTDISRR